MRASERGREERSRSKRRRRRQAQGPSSLGSRRCDKTEWMTAWQTEQLLKWRNDCRAVCLSHSPTVPLSHCTAPALMFIMKSVPFWTASCILVFIYFLFYFLFLFYDFCVSVSMWVASLPLSLSLFHIPSCCICIFLFILDRGRRHRQGVWGVALIMSGGSGT